MNNDFLVYLTYDFCGGAYVRFRIIVHCQYQNKPISKTPHLTQRSSIYLSNVSRVLNHYVPNIVATATRVAREKIAWHHSMAHPRKPP